MRTHGYHGTPIYRVWASMVKRCENQNCDAYQWYGARGISVCQEWRENPKAFCDWAINNGYKQGLEIDRIDADGDYSPENCQFITHKSNCAPGKRRTRKTSKTGERNICFTKNGTVEAYAYISGKQRFVGTYKTVAEAVEARDKAEAHDNPELLKGEPT